MTLGCLLRLRTIPLLILLKMSLLTLLLSPLTLCDSLEEKWKFCVSCRHVDPQIPTRDCFIHTRMEISGPWAEMRRFHVLLCNYPCRAKRYLDSNLVDCSPCGRQDISVVSTILPPELAWLPWRCSVGLCLHAQPSLCGDHRVSVPWGQGIHVLNIFLLFFLRVENTGPQWYLIATLLPHLWQISPCAFIEI